MDGKKQWQIKREEVDCRAMLELILQEIVDPGFRRLQEQLHAHIEDDGYIKMEKFNDLWWDVKEGLIEKGLADENLTTEEFESILRYCTKGVDQEGKATVNCEEFIEFLDWFKDGYRKPKSQIDMEFEPRACSCKCSS